MVTAVAIVLSQNLAKLASVCKSLLPFYSEFLQTSSGSQSNQDSAIDKRPYRLYHHHEHIRDDPPELLLRLTIAMLHEIASNP